MEDVALMVYLRGRMLFYKFIYDENGDVNIVSIVIIIGIVVMLAGIFRTQISELVESLLGDISDGARTAGSTTK